MITRIQIKNYRSLENVDVELGHLTVLVGRNGAGKSNFVDAIKFVQESLRNGIEAAVAKRNGLASLRRWTVDGEPCEIEIVLSVDGEAFRGTYGFVLGESVEDDFQVKRETCSIDPVGDSGLRDEFEVREGVWTKRPNDFDVPVPIDKRYTTAHRASKQLSANTLFFPALQILPQAPFVDLFASLSHGSFLSIYPNTMREPQRYINSPRMGDHGENVSSAL